MLSLFLALVLTSFTGPGKLGKMHLESENQNSKVSTAIKDRIISRSLANRPVLVLAPRQTHCEQPSVCKIGIIPRSSAWLTDSV